VVDVVLVAGFRSKVGALVELSVGVALSFIVVPRAVRVVLLVLIYLRGARQVV
jgi:hypothetical protein